jgi:N-acetylglucosaminyl-diphospho-decaprenol L-rhamnosyltransferase
LTASGSPSLNEAAIAAVIVTYESAAHITSTLEALVGQLRAGDEVVVVDNASRDGTAAAVRAAAPGARVLEQERNLGFAGGCNTGAAATSAPLLLFLNPDARLAPDCLDQLRRIAVARADWGAWQALVTMNDGSTINTAGNVAHFLGIAWAGRCGEPVGSAPSEPVEVGFPSGAALVVRRDAWELVEGFDERYFMYCEDLDLGLRLRLAGYGVGLAPAARVEHDYEFAKGERKWFLLERNRWWTVVSDYPGRLLALLLPSLLLAELALLAVAARGGWLGAKLRAQLAVVRELPQMLARRRRVQAGRQISAGEFARCLSAELDNPNLGGLAAVRPLVTMQRAYWALVLRLVG